MLGEILGSALGGLFGGGGDGGSQTASKEPWSVVAPYLTGIAKNGFNLYKDYRDNPFSQSQQNAYTGLENLSQYVQGAVPGLLGQVNNQSFFDRNNPLQRTQQFQFGNMGSGSTGTPLGQSQVPMTSGLFADLPSASAGAKSTTDQEPTTQGGLFSNAEQDWMKMMSYLVPGGAVKPNEFYAQNQQNGANRFLTANQY